MKEEFNEVKKSLLPILKGLIEEYSEFKPEKNNVMTRQNILKMITDLCGVIYGDSEVTFKDVMDAIGYLNANISNPVDNAIATIRYGKSCENKSKNDKYEDVNKRINDILNKPIGCIYQIPVGSDIFDALRSLLNSFLDKKDYFILSEVEFDTDKYKTTYTMRFSSDYTVKRVLEQILANSNGYFAFIENGIITIKKDNSFIRDINKEKYKANFR